MGVWKNPSRITVSETLRPARLEPTMMPRALECHLNHLSSLFWCLDWTWPCLAHVYMSKCKIFALSAEQVYLITWQASVYSYGKSQVQCQDKSRKSSPSQDSYIQSHIQYQRNYRNDLFESTYGNVDSSPLSQTFGNMFVYVWEDVNSFPGKWFVSAPFKLVKKLSLFSSHNKHRLATTN